MWVCGHVTDHGKCGRGGEFPRQGFSWGESKEAPVNGLSPGRTQWALGIDGALPLLGFSGVGMLLGYVLGVYKEGTIPFKDLRMPLPSNSQGGLPGLTTVYTCHHDEEFHQSLADQPRVRVSHGRHMWKGKPTCSGDSGLHFHCVTRGRVIVPVFRCSTYPVTRTILVDSSPEFPPFPPL